MRMQSTGRVSFCSFSFYVFFSPASYLHFPSPYDDSLRAGSRRWSFATGNNAPRSSCCFEWNCIHYVNCSTVRWRASVPRGHSSFRFLVAQPRRVASKRKKLWRVWPLRLLRAPTISISDYIRLEHRGHFGSSFPTKALIRGEVLRIEMHTCRCTVIYYRSIYYDRNFTRIDAE